MSNAANAGLDPDKKTSLLNIATHLAYVVAEVHKDFERFATIAQCPLPDLDAWATEIQLGLLSHLALMRSKTGPELLRTYGSLSAKKMLKLLQNVHDTRGLMRARYRELRAPYASDYPLKIQMIARLPGTLRIYKLLGDNTEILTLVLKELDSAVVGSHVVPRYDQFREYGRWILKSIHDLCCDVAHFVILQVSRRQHSDFELDMAKALVRLLGWGKGVFEAKPFGLEQLFLRDWDGTEIHRELLGHCFACIMIVQETWLFKYEDGLRDEEKSKASTRRNQLTLYLSSPMLIHTVIALWAGRVAETPHETQRQSLDQVQGQKDTEWTTCVIDDLYKMREPIWLDRARLCDLQVAYEEDQRDPNRYLISRLENGWIEFSSSNIPHFDVMVQGLRVWVERRREYIDDTLAGIADLMERQRPEIELFLSTSMKASDMGLYRLFREHFLACKWLAVTRLHHRIFDNEVSDSSDVFRRADEIMLQLMTLLYQVLEVPGIRSTSDKVDDSGDSDNSYSFNPSNSNGSNGSESAITELQDVHDLGRRSATEGQ